jgi:hypothetical protein
LLGRVGVVEEVGDDGVEDEEAWCGLCGYDVRTISR